MKVNLLKGILTVLSLICILCLSLIHILISGNEPYTVEEVDTAIRYVVPDNQTAPIQWKQVTKRNFENILKKFRVEVVKTDRVTGYAQGLSLIHIFIFSPDFRTGRCCRLYLTSPVFIWQRI